MVIRVSKSIVDSYQFWNEAKVISPVSFVHGLVHNLLSSHIARARRHVHFIILKVCTTFHVVSPGYPGSAPCLFDGQGYAGVHGWA